MDKEIEDYIQKQESNIKEMMVKLRGIFLKTLSNCKERYAWGAIVFGDDKFYIASIKDRVHIGFAIAGLSKEEINLFEGTGKTMRHIKIHSLDEIDEEKLVQLIKMVNTKSACIQN